MAFGDAINASLQCHQWYALIPKIEIINSFDICTAQYHAPATF